jgi:hypothetical protein
MPSTAPLFRALPTRRVINYWALCAVMRQRAARLFDEQCCAKNQQAAVAAAAGCAAAAGAAARP